jgi:hypothetical protein
MIIKIGNKAWQFGFDPYPNQEYFDAGWTVWLGKRWHNFYFLRWEKVAPKN